MLNLSGIISSFVILALLLSGLENFELGKKTKTILWYVDFGSGPQKRDDFVKSIDCYFTSDIKKLKQADAVFIKGNFVAELFTYRTPEQILIYFVNESPYTRTQWQYFANSGAIFNWTAHYRLDSTFPLRSGFTFKKYVGLKPSTEVINYAQNKTKIVSWLVSHCHVSNQRMEYATELKKYIDLDIYGACGSLSCIGGRGNQSCVTTMREYKFYLAFENSNCRDYITEKFWRNSIYNEIVPVVMGAPKEDYELIAPPNSFIHVDDYEGPEDLAKYLLEVASNDNIYNSFFAWKKTHGVTYMPEDMSRKVCERVHRNNGAVSWYQNFTDWFNGEGICVHPSKDNKWASWKKVNLNL